MSNNVQTEEKRVAISFDAAWGADKTEKIMEILQEYDANATFFLVGFWSEKYPELLRERYGLTQFDDKVAMLEGVCRRRGFMLRGGEFDYERGERAVIDDFRKGRLGGITLDEPSDCDGYDF